MEWEVFKLKQTGGRTAPFVSIGRGALDFSQAACELINDTGDYKYAQLLTTKEKGKVIVGVKFLTEYEDNSLPVKRKSINGKAIAGMTIRNKDAIERLFGKDGANKGMVRHQVVPVGNNILKIID